MTGILQQLLLLFVVVGPAPAADDRAPEELVDKAKAAFADGRFEDCLQFLEAAQRAEPSPANKFMMARCLRYLDRCEEAIPLYREFLESDPIEDAVAATKEDLKLCGADPSDPPPPTSAEEAPPVSRPSPAVSPEASTTAGQPAVTTEGRAGPVDRPPRRDHGSLALIGVGSGVFAAGAAMGIAGGVIVQASPDEQDVDAYDDAVRRGQITGGIGWSLAAVGVGLATAGVVRLVLRRRRGRVAARRGWGGVRF